MKKINLLIIVFSLLLMFCESDTSVSNDDSGTNTTTEKTKFELYVVDELTDERVVATITNELELEVDADMINTDELDPNFEVCESVEWNINNSQMVYNTTKSAFDARFSSNVGIDCCMITGKVSFEIKASGYKTKTYSTRFYQGENKVVTVKLEKE